MQNTTVKTGKGWNWLWAAEKSYGGEESDQRLRAGNKPPIEFNFFTAWTILMKLGTLVHHVYGYQTLRRIFKFLPRDLVMVFQNGKTG